MKITIEKNAILTMDGDEARALLNELSSLYRNTSMLSSRPTLRSLLHTLNEDI